MNEKRVKMDETRFFTNKNVRVAMDEARCLVDEKRVLWWKKHAF